ncbi:Uncharacterized protein AXF42_Ash003863 [Apostasia shenzhenica]|uniref:Hydroxyproline-rich glycoprotein family protein n=1 Tax=Apostasia shenzhenica TaxID=1088818 RepID=A0A2I0AIC9_9ASPA|nr:Uncharacterized protein AXF42_Ash003863 [Apostasia shenzhenica]
MIAFRWCFILVCTSFVSLVLCAKALPFFLLLASRNSLLGRLRSAPLVEILFAVVLNRSSTPARVRRKYEMTLPIPMESAPLLPMNICEDSSWMGVVKAEVMRFRDSLGLRCRDGSVDLNELLIGTLEDIKNQYKKYSSFIPIFEGNHDSLHQVLLHVCIVLKSIGDSWSGNYNHSTISELDLETLSIQQLSERALEMLKYMISQSREMFNLFEIDSSNVSLSNGRSNATYLVCPHTPSSVLSDTPKGFSKPDSNICYIPPLLTPLRLQAIGNWQHLDAKHLSLHMYPVVLDHSTHLGHQIDQNADDFTLDLPKDLMNLEVDLPAITEKDANNSNANQQSEPTFLGSTPKTPTLRLTSAALGLTMSCSPSTSGPIYTEFSKPSMTHFEKVNFGPISQEGTKNDTGADQRSSIFSLPKLQSGASALQSPTPTPPSSPMLLAGVFMPFSPSGHPQLSLEHPFAYAMAVSNFDDDNGSKIPEMTVVASQPSKQSLHPKSPLGLLEFHLPPVMSHSKSPLAQPPDPPPLPPKSPLIIPAPPPSTPKGPPPPPPPPGGSASISPTHSTLLLAKGSAATVPPPSPAQGVAPPPPPLVMRSLRAKVSKLKRSTQMSNLYRLLKRKIEGSNLPDKASKQRKSQTTVSCGSKMGGKGMADALAEMTKRSSYFQQIEDDVQKYSSSIVEMKSAISNFHTKDGVQLQTFHQNVEKQLEKLTDETQVLARFEDFPYKKLETIRVAAALYVKLDGILATLKSWKMVHPISKQLDKIESYFCKTKEEVDATECTKDEESKRFQSNNIEFDFGVLLRIKEAIVDLSSNCIEMALKEGHAYAWQSTASVKLLGGYSSGAGGILCSYSLHDLHWKKEGRELKEVLGDDKLKANYKLSKVLWRAFQLAFRVYNFAGGQDERADQLTSELAREIETYSHF